MKSFCKNKSSGSVGMNKIVVSLIITEGDLLTKSEKFHGLLSDSHTATCSSNRKTISRLWEKEK